MKGNFIKIATLIVLIVLVVITFNLTKENEDKKEGLQISSNTSSKDDNKKENNETIIIDKQDDIENNDVVEEKDNIIRQYKLYNNYVVTSENTQYKEVDYKYYIIRSYSEFEKYLNDYIIDFSDDNKYSNYNKNEKDEILENIDKDFFNENCIILLSDVNSKKQINGNISEISINEEKTVDIKIKKETNDNLSNAITYIIPVEKGVKQVKAKHIN